MDILTLNHPGGILIVIIAVVWMTATIIRQAKSK